MSPLLFSTIEVTRQVFYRTSLSYAIVNLKPIIPGHVLVIPTRPAVRLADLNQEEISSLFRTVQTVGKALERAYNAEALTIACQDGEAAGQTIPHVHVHIIPRRFKSDKFGSNNDEIYPAIEQGEKDLTRQFQIAPKEPESFKVDADEDRKPRSLVDMEKEAQWLQSFFDSP